MTDPTTIEEAIETVALGMVKSEKDAQGNEIEHLSIDDLIKAERHLAGKTASGKSHFGMRMTKCVPPGGG